MTGQRTIRIREAFAKATDYDSQATAQASSARRLAGLILDHGPSDLARVLDMGCGTGGLALHLLARGSAGLYLCADISSAMLRRARAKLGGAAPRPLFAAMDASAPALKPGFDLVASNMALHWVPDMGATLAGLWELVAPGGALAVAVPGEGTFRPWREAHQRLGLSCGLQDFPSASELAGLFPVAPEVFEETYPLDFQHALDLPRHLKALGGYVARPGHAPLAPGRFRAVLAALDADAPPMGYHVLFALALKPAQE